MKKIFVSLFLFLFLLKPVYGENNTGSLTEQKTVTSSGIVKENLTTNTTNNTKITDKSEETKTKEKNSNQAIEEKLTPETKLLEETIKKEIEEEQKNSLEENIVTKAYKERKEQIFDLVKKSPEEIEKTKLEKIINTIKIENNLNKELLEKLNNDISALKETIEKKDIELQKKENKIKEISKNKDNKDKIISKLEREKKALYQSKINLLNELRKKIRSEKTLENNIKNLELLKEKYNLEHKKLIKTQEELEKKNWINLKDKLNVLYIFLAILLFLYLLRYLVLNHTNFKKKHTKLVTVGELALGILIVIFGIWYFFYLFPNLYILVIFLSGYLLLVNAHLIASFMGSLIVVNKYSVGEMVKIGDYLGKIERIGTVYTVISEIDEKGFLHTNYKYIPNVIIVKEGLEKVKDYTIKQRTFTIKLLLNKQNTIFKIVDYIKNNILLKYINFRPKHLDPNNNEVFEIKYEQEKVGEVKITFFWFSTEEVSRKIKKRIIGYIEQQTTNLDTPLEDEKKENTKQDEKNSGDDLKFMGV